MRRAGRIAAIGALSATLFVAGGIGLFRAGEPAPTPVLISELGSALLGPGGGGDVDGTIAVLQARLRMDSRDWRALASLGLAYLQKGRLTADPTWLPKAEGALDRSLRLNESENFPGLLGQGVLALGRHDFAGALGWGEQARELNPYNAQARGVIGDALLELGRYDEASGAYQDMVDLRPDLSSYARISYYRELTGDLRGAIAAMAEAVELAGTPEDAAWAGFHLGELYYGSGRVGAAAHAYRAAAGAAPGSVLPSVGLARVAAARGALDRAIEILSDVVARYPAPEFVILLGDLYSADGREEQAAEQYDLVRAMERLFRSGGVNTDMETALFDADHGFRIQAALARARAEYQRRPSVQAADALAWALYSNGRYREAQRHALAALRLGTRSALFRFHAGMIALRLGDATAARDHLRAALDINPHFSFLHVDAARRALERLE